MFKTNLLERARLGPALAAVFAVIAMIVVTLFSPIVSSANATEVEDDPDAVMLNGIDVNKLTLDELIEAFDLPHPEFSQSKEIVSPYTLTRAGDNGEIDGPYSTPPLPDPSYGPGWVWNFLIGDAPLHWLGAQKPGDAIEFCRNFDSLAPKGSGVASPVTPRAISSNPSIAAMQVESNEQMGYIISKWYGAGADEAAESIHNAAISTVVHLSYEKGGGEQYLTNFVNLLLSDSPNSRLIAQWAQNVVEDAKENAGKNDLSGSQTVSPGKQEIEIKDIGYKKVGGDYIGGVKFTVTLNGDAKWTNVPNGTISTDGKVWTGTTVAGSTVSGFAESTANGKVSSQVKFFGIESESVQAMIRDNGTQDTIKFVGSSTDPVLPLSPEENVWYDFQPQAVSNVGGYQKITGNEIGDTLTVSVKDDEPWLGSLKTFPGQTATNEGTISYSPLPVKFKGTAYYVGETPPAEGAEVPSSATPVATAEFFAEKGEGDYSVKVTPDKGKMPAGGFINWVWEVDKADQPKIDDDELYMIRDNWSDRYGIFEETTSKMFPGKVESNLKVHTTNDNTYMVDDVWISKLPTDHPEFQGGNGWKADVKTISQSLYFWEGVTDGSTIKSIDDAELIGTVTIPAKNGFYPSVGSGDFAAKRDANGDPVKGVYQMVHHFEGDDRVAAFTSEIPDIHEQYVETGEPTIGTTAMGEAGDIVRAFEDVTITDNVCYSNLTPGKTYDLEGILMDQATGKPLLSEGKEVKGNTTFTPSTPDGCVDVEFNFNAVDLGGTTTVVFEDLYLDGVKVATHTDIEDEGQTVYIPEIGTTAMGEAENMVPADEEVTITDSVCYTNLVAGKEYTVSGVLMNKETGEPLLVDGKEVTGETTFSPEDSEGCVDMLFTFNSSALAGTTIVVFEDLYLDGIKVATHADIEDEGQTVYVPKLKTTATGSDGKKVTDAGKSVTIIDEVCYTNVTPGKEYKLTGVLMDKTSNKPFLDNGKEVTSEKIFTAVKSEGCEKVEFKFDASSLGGKSVVVFEDLYLEDTLLATHADIEDEGQTVSFTPGLAKTGANGLVLLGVGGVLLLGGLSVALVARNRKGKVA